MLVVEKGFPSMPREVFTLIALFAVTNTALVNFVMSSRILYGMSREKLVPPILGQVHLKRGTPHFAISVVFIIAIGLALTEGLEVLAQATSLLLLSVFFVMNLSLTVIKIRPATAHSEPPPFQTPIWIPILGAISCVLLIFFVKLQALITVLILILMGAIIYMIQKRQL